MPKEETREERLTRIAKELEEDEKVVDKEAEEEEEEIRPKARGAKPELPTEKKETKISKTVLAVALGAVILISLMVSFIMVPKLAPSRLEFETQAGSTSNKFTQVDARINAVNSSIPDISILATKAELSNYATKSDLNNYATNANLNAANSRINSVEAILDSQIPNTLSYSLNGTFGNYTLSLLTTEAGNYTAIVHMLYNPAKNVGVVNGTSEDALVDFYSGGNWTTSLDKNYIPVLLLSSSQWKVSKVSFYTDSFSLTANNTTTVSVTFTGLKYACDTAYAEIFKVV